MKQFSRTRRDFVKLLGSGVAAVYLHGCTSTPAKKFASQLESLKAEDIERKLASISPVDRQIQTSDFLLFSGDVPDRAHSILWDKQRFISAQGGKLPKPTRSVPVAIVGGGMSGLMSAYFLRDMNPVLLEQAPRFGGNSKGESWLGNDYTIGAGYTTLPKPDSEIAQFWKEIGVDREARVCNEADPLFVGSHLYKDCWKEGTTAGTRHQFQKLARFFTDVLHEKNGNYFPNIPAYTQKDRQHVNQLDKITFADHLKKVLGEDLHPHVEEVLESYFWTAFAGSYAEVSAAAGLNFFAGDFEGRAVFPAGNSTIAEGILKKLIHQFDSQQLLTSSLVFDARVVEDGVVLSYANAEGKVESLHAQYVILSCPKFVVAKMVDGLEAERLAAIQSLKYRSYLVANALIEQPLEDSFYDLYFFDGKEHPVRRSSVKEDARRQKVTDLFHGSYSKPNSKRTVLTLSRAFPYDQCREEIYQKDAYSRFRQEFEEQLTQSILPLLKISPEKLVDLRLTRWGHPLPVPLVGNYSNGIVDAIRKPFRDRIFFAEQDNWTLPCFENAFAESKTWTSVVRKHLGQA